MRRFVIISLMGGVRAQSGKSLKSNIVTVCFISKCLFSRNENSLNKFMKISSFMRKSFLQVHPPQFWQWCRKFNDFMCIDKQLQAPSASAI